MQVLAEVSAEGKEPYKTDDILQKRPTILRSLLIVARYVLEEGLLHLREQWELLAEGSVH